MEPAWGLLALFPGQGDWTEEDYLALDQVRDSRRLVELVDGRLEVLPAPIEEHQSIILFLLEALRAFVRPRRAGKVSFAGLRVRVKPGQFREPDIVFLSNKHASKRGSKYWTGADLAMEVVSPDDTDRDYVTKRREYARAGVREYWIVDPATRTILLLVLKGRSYVQRGRYTDGDQCASALLSGFAVNVTEVFDAANE